MAAGKETPLTASHGISLLLSCVDQKLSKDTSDSDSESDFEFDEDIEFLDDSQYKFMDETSKRALKKEQIRLIRCFENKADIMEQIELTSIVEETHDGKDLMPMLKKYFQKNGDYLLDLSREEIPEWIECMQFDEDH